MKKLTIVIYLAGATNRGMGPKHYALGASGKNYEFPWISARRQYVYASVELTADGVEKELARVTADMNDMVAGLGGLAQYAAYKPAFVVEGLETDHEIRCAPPARLILQEERLCLRAMVAEGLVGSGYDGEIQPDDIRNFLATPSAADILALSAPLG